MSDEVVNGFDDMLVVPPRGEVKVVTGTKFFAKKDASIGKDQILAALRFKLGGEDPKDYSPVSLEMFAFLETEEGKQEASTTYLKVIPDTVRRKLEQEVYTRLYDKYGGKKEGSAISSSPEFQTEVLKTVADGAVEWRKGINIIKVADEDIALEVSKIVPPDMEREDKLAMENLKLSDYWPELSDEEKAGLFAVRADRAGARLHEYGRKLVEMGHEVGMVALLLSGKLDRDDFGMAVEKFGKDSRVLTRVNQLYKDGGAVYLPNLMGTGRIPMVRIDSGGKATSFVHPYDEEITDEMVKKGAYFKAAVKGDQTNFPKSADLVLKMID